TNWTYVEGFGVGVAGTYGDRDGAPSGYLTPGQRTWFSYNANVTGDGEASRLVPQGYWYYGPFGFLGEWAISRQRLTTTSGAPIRDNIQTEAWQFAAYYVIFGGDASYKGVKPKKEFDLSGENWGALELVGRYGEQWIDDSVFIARGGQSLASTTANARSIDTWGVGLNWYLNTNVRLVLDYNHSNFSSRGLANTAVPRDDEQAVFSRLQLSF
ncbi:MAG: porin, partial [Verrucomicrobiae bacterium]|nr:porin [Verrucomicrobiae bacterium]